LKGHVNASGFPLQIGVGNLVDNTSHRHGWKTLYTEHSWSNSETGESGFIDLVLSNSANTKYFTVECKRVKDTSWIFLNEGAEVKLRRHSKAFIFKKDGTQVNQFGWSDVTLEPSSPESQFCVIPGTGSKSKSLIERAAAELVSSTEALAMEDKSLSLDDRWTLGIYFNLIVTTAKIQVCSFEKTDISIADGTISNPKFDEVAYVRFRKQLSPTYNLPEIFRVAGYEDRAYAKENTVFVVNSEHLVEFLVNFELDNDDYK
jgi:hypothetical protein